MGGMSYKPQRERERERDRSKTARKTLNEQDPLPVLYMTFELVQGFNRMDPLQAASLQGLAQKQN
jgi:hypothetical protein